MKRLTPCIALALLCGADFAAAFAGLGGRKLDRRTRAFWELVLDARSSPPSAAAEALWPGT